MRIQSLPQKGGPAAARNKGWQLAVANLIAFTDDDTLPQRDWLKNFNAAYKGENTIAFTGKVIVPRPQLPTDYEKNIAHLETADFVTANCMCTKAALESVAGFDEAFKMAWREDSDLHFKLLQAGIPIQFAEGAAIVHPVRAARWGVSIKEQKKSMYNALLYKKFPLLYRQQIMHKPVWNYYAIIALFFASMLLLILKAYTISLVTLLIWLKMIIHFTFKRLRGTSPIIPFVSVFWTLYGAFRFKVFFL